MALPGGYSGGGLPATNPQDFAAYLDAHFKGDRGVLGGPVAALDSQGATGSSLGAQWLTWYAQEQATHPGATLLDYETAFVLLWSDATFGGDLAAGLAGGSTAAGDFASSAAGTLTTAGELGSIFSVLQSGALWLRIAEGLLGIVLIAIGIARMTNAVPAATRIARAVA